MKFKFTLTLVFAVLMGLTSLTAQRYTTEIFSDVDVESNVVYSTNITIITGAPTIDTLKADIYMPPGTDTETARPLIVYAHTGSFLPRPLNGQATGDKDDYTVVESCTRLAKMGYVAAAITYRKGWNPLDTTAELRRRGLIQAAYRGIQDFRTFVRFMRKSVDNGNPYGINPDKIAGWGQGTGGYIVAASAVLTQDEIYIPKFQDPLTGASFIDSNLVGNIDGTTMKPLNIPSNLGYSGAIQMAFNFGGALGDVSWVDAGEPPILAAHVVKDPFAPFGIDFTTGNVNCEGPVIVPTTQEFVVNVAGSNCMVDASNSLGNNDIMTISPSGTPYEFTDDYSAAIAGKVFAQPNLWPIWTPGIEAGPWDYWDAAYWGQIPHPSCGGVPPPDCSFHTIGLLTNPDMSLDKANRYIDTLVAFFAPRACLALGLGCQDIVLSNKDVLNNVDVTISPNPATSEVRIAVEGNRPMTGVYLYDLNGRLVNSAQNVNNTIYNLQRDGLPNGMYIARLQFKDGIVARKVLFE